CVPRPMSPSGQKRTNHRGPKCTDVRYAPNSDRSRHKSELTQCAISDNARVVWRLQAPRGCSQHDSGARQPGSIPLALMTEIAAGVVRNLISACAAALSLALVPTPPVRTM